MTLNNAQHLQASSYSFILFGAGCEHLARCPGEGHLESALLLDAYEIALPWLVLNRGGR